MNTIHYEIHRVEELYALHNVTDQIMYLCSSRRQCAEKLRELYPKHRIWTDGEKALLIPSDSQEYGIRYTQAGCFGFNVL